MKNDETKKLADLAWKNFQIARSNRNIRIKFLSKQDLERGGRENSPRLRIKRKKEKGNEKQRAEEGRHPLKKLQSRSSRLIRAWEEEWDAMDEREGGKI